jgi:hypothetical protein
MMVFRGWKPSALSRTHTSAWTRQPMADTMVGSPSSVTTSWTGTMPGCRSCAAARASRWNRSMSSSAVNRPVCGILRATTRSSSVSRAFHTAPKAPTPTRSSNWNLPSRRMPVVAVCRASRTRKELPQPGQSTSSGRSSASWIGLWQCGQRRPYAPGGSVDPGGAGGSAAGCAVGVGSGCVLADAATASATHAGSRVGKRAWYSAACGCSPCFRRYSTSTAM